MIPQVQLTLSAIHRQGVTATAPFREGDRILPIDDSRAVTPSHPLDEAKGEFSHHCDYLAQGRVVLMQPPERFINHSCDPNTYVKTIDGVRWVIARRPIAPGEEITFDYSINSSGDTVWTCHCGSPRCRRQVHSDFFHLPPDLQREYFPLLDDWYRDEHNIR